MDRFSQSKYLSIVIAVLVLINLGTLTMLWIGRPSNMMHPERKKGPRHEQKPIHQLLQNELGFDAAQIESYLRLRKQHQRATLLIEREIMDLKRQMFDDVLTGDQHAVLSETLLSEIQDRNAALDRLTFKHLMDLKKLCRPDQQNELQILIHELFQKSKPRGAPPPDRP